MRFFLAVIVLVSYTVLVLSPAAAAETLRPTPPMELSRNVMPVSPPTVPVGPAAGEGSGLSMRTVHRYLGYGALALGAVAAVSSSSEDLHCASAWGACILGSAALTTGIIKYRRTVDLGDGLSRVDMHALLGGLATAGFIAAVLLAGSGGEDEDDEVNSAHAGAGIASLATMAVSVVVIELKW